jgi:glycosyltransferase involved in cell wall biosynthesis
MKKRILIFSLVYYPRFVGGAEVAIKEITDRISPSEIEFDMVTLRSKGEKKHERIGNINVYRVGFPVLGMKFNKYFFLKTGFWKAVFLNFKYKYDAVWSMMATYNSFAALFFKIFHPKIPFLLTLQEGDPIPYIKERAKPLWPLFKRIFTKADHIQTISHYLANFAKEMKATCPITVVPNGVDVAHFSLEISDEKKQGVYNIISSSGSFSRKENDVLLITTSRLVKKNAVGDIIESLVHLPTNYKLIICGIGQEQEILEQKVIAHDFLHRVYFADYVPHSDMPVWLHASDIFIRPSISEGFGNSFIEAMASLVPVIATPVGGIVDFLKDRETGLFCEVSNPQSIAQKVLELTENQNLKKHIVDTAFRMVEEKYDWNNVAGQMEKVIKKFDIINELIKYEK